MTKTPALEGIYVPLLAPLDDDAALDGASLDRLVDHVLDGGVDGLWVNGTTGEFHALADDERTGLVKHVVARAAGRVPVVAQCGDPATPRAIALARAALDVGATHIAAVPPYYLANTQAEIANHYRGMSDAIGRPVVVYDFPLFCKVAVTTPTLVSLAEEGVICGIKESAPSLDSFRRLVLEVGEAAPEFRCLHGGGGTAAASLYLGGHGVVCALANVAPDGYARLVAHAARGEWDDALREQEAINRLGDALADAVADRPATTAPMAAAMKTWLRARGVLATDTLRPPAAPLTDDQRARIEALA